MREDASGRLELESRWGLFELSTHKVLKQWVQHSRLVLCKLPKVLQNVQIYQLSLVHQSSPLVPSCFIVHAAHRK